MSVASKVASLFLKWVAMVDKQIVVGAKSIIRFCCNHPDITLTFCKTPVSSSDVSSWSYNVQKQKCLFPNEIWNYSHCFKHIKLRYKMKFIWQATPTSPLPYLKLSEFVNATSDVASHHQTIRYNVELLSIFELWLDATVFCRPVFAEVNRGCMFS